MELKFSHMCYTGHIKDSATTAFRGGGEEATGVTEKDEK